MVPGYAVTGTHVQRRSHDEPHVPTDVLGASLADSESQHGYDNTDGAAHHRSSPDEVAALALRMSPATRGLSRRQFSLLAATLHPSPLPEGGSPYSGTEKAENRRLSSGLGAGIAVDALVEEDDEDGEEDEVYDNEEADAHLGGDGGREGHGDVVDTNSDAASTGQVDGGSLQLVARGEQRRRRHQPTRAHARLVEEAYERAAAEAEAALAAIRASALSRSPPGAPSAVRGSPLVEGTAPVTNSGDIAAPANARQRSLFTRTLQPAASLPALFAAEVATAEADAALLATTSTGAAGGSSDHRVSASRRHRRSHGIRDGAGALSSLGASGTASSSQSSASDDDDNDDDVGVVRHRSRRHTRRSGSPSKNASSLLCDAYAEMSFRAARGGGEAAVHAPVPHSPAQADRTESSEGNAAPPAAGAKAGPMLSASTSRVDSSGSSSNSVPTTAVPTSSAEVGECGTAAVDAGLPQLSARLRPLRPRVSFAAMPQISEASAQETDETPVTSRADATLSSTPPPANVRVPLQGRDAAITAVIPAGRSPIMALLARTSSAVPGRRGMQAAAGRRQSGRHIGTAVGGGEGLLSLAEERFREALGRGSGPDDGDL